eukprot:3458243-Amphidinium_carterae.1
MELEPVRLNSSLNREVDATSAASSSVSNPLIYRAPVLNAALTELELERRKRTYHLGETVSSGKTILILHLVLQRSLIDYIPLSSPPA